LAATVVDSLHLEPEPARSVRVNLGSGIYGLITIGALMAAETARRETYQETVGGVALAAIVYWLAHAYGEFAALRVREGERMTLHNLRAMLWQEVPILVGAALPLLVLIFAWIFGAHLSSGITAALWAVVGALIVIELVAGLRARLSGRELVIQAAVGATLGLSVLVLRLVMH
jgi:hypothetical protein